MVSEQDNLLPPFPSEKTVTDQFYLKATNLDLEKGKQTRHERLTLNNCYRIC